MPQEHERGLGGWQAEWETLPEVFLLTSGALSMIRHVVEGLHVDVERMRANLDATNGLVYAESVSTSLADVIGRTEALQLVKRVCERAVEERRHLMEVALADSEITKHISAAELRSLFDPREHVRAAARLVDEALAGARASIPASATEGSPCPS
jgi:3-carboxy-cis,cis-muconate cycloisomerase